MGIAATTIAKWFAMALHNYPKKIETEGREVRHVLKKSGTVAWQKSVLCGRWGKYSYYSPEERDVIGKYAAEKGAKQAAKHFSHTLGQTLNEPIARRLKDEYQSDSSYEFKEGGFGQHHLHGEEPQ